MATVTSSTALSPAQLQHRAAARRPLNVTCNAAPTPMTRMKKAGVALVGAAILASSAPAFAAADLGIGQEIFDGNCAACHAGGQNSVVAERTLEKSAITQYLEGGLDVKAIEYQVRNGKNAMPAWADRLDDEEIESVAAYVFKQASDSLW